MNKLSTLLAALSFVLLLVSCKPTPAKMKFSSDEEVARFTWNLDDFSPALPDNWSDFNYLVLEMRASSPQRFLVGPVTPDDTLAKSIQPFPGAWVRFCIPLEFYRELPPPAIDLAATYNKSRDLGQINIHNPGLGPVSDVTGLTFFMKNPINNPTLEIRKAYLTVENPGDTLLQKGYLVDSFGQWATQQWEGKIKSMDELKAAWKEEDQQLKPLSDQVSQYGGYTAKQYTPTGFFRVEKIDGIWWFIDPEGYPLLSTGVNCMNASSKTRTTGREYIFEGLKKTNDDSQTADYYNWNIQERYGNDVKNGWVNTAVKRMNAWGLNTIANWSSPDIIQSNQVPFTLSLYGLMLDKDLMGFADIYAPDFDSNIDQAIAGLTSQYKDNPWLIGYFVGNEQPWPNQETILCDRILAGEDRPIKKALQEYLKANGNTDEAKRDFIIKSFSQFLEKVNTTLKKHDPNHLNLGMRFNDSSDDVIAEAGKNFDVFSINAYQVAPPEELMNRIDRLTGLPIIIGEYHFGTPDRGMAAGIVQVSSHKERGNAFRYYNEQGFSHPNLIGTHWFQWIDQPGTGRNDGENYNIGLVDVTDRPYPDMVEAMQLTHQRLFDVHSGTTEPYDVEPVTVHY